VNVLDTFRLEGQTAVVTGGAGLFGRQIVEALAEAGAHVVAASRNVEQNEAMAVPLRQRGFDVCVCCLDQSSEASILTLRDSVIQNFGGADVLVNNAVARSMKSWSGSADSFKQSINVNATGLFLITRAFGEYMAEYSRGSIINVGSIQGLVGPNFTLYQDLGWAVPPDYFFHKGALIN
jgi:NAD(P)-dependent dehydrogenase (short-subunit alcohol dehydrogenase family)